MKNDFLQNMAPNAKRSAVFTIAFGAIATVIYMFAVEPAETQLAQAQQKLDELTTIQNRMNADLKGAENTKKSLEDLNAQLKPYQDAMLTPLLESYAMRAKSILDPLLLGAGLTEIDYADEPFRALPLPKSSLPVQLHTRATIRITARGSYQEAISFLLRLEKEFPLVSLCMLEIQSQQTNTKQGITFVLEWPAVGGVTRK